MKRRTRYALMALLAVFVLAGTAAAALLLFHKTYEIRMLYAVPEGDYDRSAVQHLQQTLTAGVRLDVKRLDRLKPKEIARYDAVYPAPELAGSEALRSRTDDLTAYVKRGGSLFLENALLPHLPAQLLGGEVTAVPAGPVLNWTYPQTDASLARFQTIIRQYARNFQAHVGLDYMPGFAWGYGLKPGTGSAQPIAVWNGVALYAVNRLGEGSVISASAFLPNRYFLTGYDLTSGQTPELGFANAVEQHNDRPSAPGTTYFDRSRLPLEPYFDFGFAAGSSLLRGEYASFVFREKYGFNVRKVLGPNGRPAMAHQNHFEALEAFRDKEGIQWAELLKEYNQIPTFTLVRSAFTWHQWKESVTVHLNVGETRLAAKPAAGAPDASGASFVGIVPSSFYSSGIHLQSGGGHLTLAAYPKKQPLSGLPSEPYRASPALLDYDGDGRLDLAVGSSDGGVYLYRADPGADAAEAYRAETLPDGVPPPPAYAAPTPALLPGGAKLRAGSGYAALAAADLDGDGRAELLIAAADGRVLYAKHRGGATFEQPRPLTAAGAPMRAETGYAAPAVADWDGDGTPDIAIGAADGSVTLYRGVPGQPFRYERGVAAIAPSDAGYAAPAGIDWNGDGRAELLVGTIEGDLTLYERPAGAAGMAGWTRVGPVRGQTLNQMGNDALVGGHYAMPLAADVNGDGRTDLVVGQLEYSPPYPLDDPDFPYKAELREFLDYAARNKLELMPHLFFHNYMTPEQEKAEIALHQESFRKLGLPWTLTGTNQHTWRVGHLDPRQTFRSESEAGIWFNFGFRAPYSPEEPHYGRPYLWGLPFLLQDGELARPMVLGTPIQIWRGEATRDIYDSYAMLDLPIDYFEHIEYHFPGRVPELLAYVKVLDEIRNTHDYNFVTEMQMAKASIAALAGDVRISQSWASWLWDKLRDKVRGGVHFGVTLTARVSGPAAELAGDYVRAMGATIETGPALSRYRLDTDSPIYSRGPGSLHVAIDGQTRITIGWGPEPFHLLRSNVPTTVEPIDDGKAGWRIKLNDDGMQQAKLYSPAPLAIEGPDGLKVEEGRLGDGYFYTVTHFGERIEVTARPAPG